MPTPPTDAGVAWLTPARPEVERGRSPPLTGTGGWRRRWGVGRRETTRPLLGNDRVELRLKELLVRAHQLQELLVHTARDVNLSSRGGGHEYHPRGQALMACWPSFLLLISILRGLACSATGIFKVSTPVS